MVDENRPQRQIEGPGAVPTARLNVTWAGQNGDYPDPIPFTHPLTPETKQGVLDMAAEAIRTGYIPGIAADENVDLEGFEVDVFPATDGQPDNRAFIRSKTPYGGGRCS